MNNEIKILYDEKKVLVSPPVLEKIKYLTREDDVYSIEKIQLTNEMDIKEFYRRIESILQRSETMVRFLPDRKNTINYNTDLMYFLAQKYNELYPEEKREFSYIEDEKIYDLLNIIYQIDEEVKNYYLICDLVTAKNDCLKNMKYFLDDTTISEFNDEYETAIQNQDVKKMKSMLNNIEQAILKEWEKYFTNIDTMNDENFSFIGHSTNSPKFDANFYSKYVSTSLFNQDLTDTYRAGYGFIFAPKNIVGANSQDMFVNNYVEDEDMMYTYSTIRKIDHPQRLVDECMKLRDVNAENSETQKIYSEVIIEGFDPIGIFCFTDGSKNLNWNYRYAQQLHECFPHLKIYSFDIMKRKKGKQLDEMKLALLNRLQQQFANYTFDISLDMLFRYEYFFEEYEKLKQKETYTEDEIEYIFRYNTELLSVFNTEPDDLFHGKYDNKTIKYILGKNVNYNIDYILSGKAKAFALNNLKKLYPYKDKLNSIYDGLSEFLELAIRIEITDKIMSEINSNNPINFYTITKVLASKLTKTINSREEKTKQALNNYQTKYNELQKEVHERTIIQEQYEYYYLIYLNKNYREMIEKDYKSLIDDIRSTEQKEIELQIELKKIETTLNEIDEQIKILEHSTYDNDTEHIFFNETIAQINVNLSELAKHPLINRKKIRQEKNKLKGLEENDTTLKMNFETQISEKICNLKLKKTKLQLEKEKIESDLRLTQSNKEQLYGQLETLKSKLKKYFKCESIDEVDLVISEAESFINGFDFMNQYYLTKLNIQLEELTTIIANQQNDLNAIQEEKELISKFMK